MLSGHTEHELLPIGLYRKYVEEKTISVLEYITSTQWSCSEATICHGIGPLLLRSSSRLDGDINIDIDWWYLNIPQDSSSCAEQSGHWALVTIARGLMPSSGRCDPVWFPGPHLQDQQVITHDQSFKAKVKQVIRYFNNVFVQLPNC